MLVVHIEKLANSILDLGQFLWKKRVLLIKENFFNTAQTKFILVKSRIEIKNNKIKIMHDPYLAADGANCIITDTWTSMGDKKISPENIFLPYQVNENIMSLADKNAIFMHCLPAYRGKEVSKEVFEGIQSVVFDEAENRLHAQKAIMHYCLS